MPRLANQTGATTKADLQDQIDSAIEILDDAYTPNRRVRNSLRQLAPRSGR